MFLKNRNSTENMGTLSCFDQLNVLFTIVYSSHGGSLLQPVMMLNWLSLEKTAFNQFPLSGLRVHMTSHVR